MDRNGQRAIPVEELYAGYLENTLKAGELITHVEIPPLGKRRAAYLKCTTRSADDWPAVGVAVVLGDENADLRFGGDRPADADRGRSALAALKIEGDLHGSAAYKRQLLQVYLRRAIDEARNASH